MAKSTRGSSRAEAETKRAKVRPQKRHLAGDDLRIVFGVNFRAARIKTGLSQIQVAALLHTTPQYISKIEHGKQNVTLGTMQALAQLVRDDVVRLLRKPRHPAKQK